MVLGERPDGHARPRTRRPGSGCETIDVRTEDGWSLRTDIHEPARPVVGVAVLAHALMARRSEFCRPNRADRVRLLVERGWRVIAFDFRGHGDSGPGAHRGARVAYDDFVLRDLPAIAAFARSRARRGRPVVAIGHSLGGHVALAAQGAGLVGFDAVVGVAANVWLRRFEPSTARWLAKRAVLAAAVATCRKLGRFPARALHLGSDDETTACVNDLERFARTGCWASTGGDIDYLAGLGRVRVPVLQIVSDGDRLACPPECGERFAAHCAVRPAVLRVGASGGRSAAPDHMGLVTAGHHDAWQRAEEWMRGLARHAARSASAG